VIYQASRVSIPMITRGTSNVVLLAERYMKPADYYTGIDLGDNEATYVGMDNDNSRSTLTLPVQDSNTYPFATPGQNTQIFGSAHSNGLNVLLCDGSVQFMMYDMNVTIWNNLGQRWE
jgi:prepilin-type processing-associated H-X9-DG protein